MSEKGDHIQSHIIFQSISFCIDFCRQQQPGRRSPETSICILGAKHEIPASEQPIDSSMEVEVEEQDHIWPVNLSQDAVTCDPWPALFHLNTPSVKEAAETSPESWVQDSTKLTDTELLYGAQRY